MQTQLRYPIGQQSFEMLRKEGFLYVDKTRYIELLLKGSQYYFLGRPRRFGKSLFLSTLKCFFEGKRYLFQGLYADGMNWDWTSYPVFYLDLNSSRYEDESSLDALLEQHIINWERKYEVVPDVTDLSVRFGELIRRTSRKSGLPVVILVDEYDKPLVNAIHDTARFNRLRDKIASIYSNFKSCSDHIKMVFLTGVSRFGKLSVFSDLNNLTDISFDMDFSGICGISEEELLENFQEGIGMLSQAHGLSAEQTLSELKRRYDGYHFSQTSEDIYNPFSLLSVFAKREYDNYWIQSGTPKLLLDQLRRTNTDLEQLTSARCRKSDLSGLDIDNIEPIPLFYQTGYLTIKDYEPRRQLFRLGLPNDEVTDGFYSYILPAYTTLKEPEVTSFVYDMLDEMEHGMVDTFMRRLQSLFSSASYEMEMENERNVQNAIFILFRLLGLNTEVEYRTSDGRIDILVRTDRYVYVMELKYDSSAEEALRQIETKKYHLPWASDSRTVIGVGINYSKKKRTIERWQFRILHN